MPKNFEGQKESLKETPGIPEAVEIIENSIEVSPTFDENLAICVVKPDAFKNREAIIKRLEDSGLYIVQRSTKQLTEQFVVGEMYKSEELPKPIAEATKRHFLSGDSEVILVKGDNVVQKLLETVGLKTNPALCSPETIRHIYGDHVPEELEEGLKYYRNAAHRPGNRKEASEDLGKFKGLL